MTGQDQNKHTNPPQQHLTLRHLIQFQSCVMITKLKAQSYGIFAATYTPGTPSF